MLRLNLFISLFFVAEIYGRDAEYICKPNFVLAISKESDREIDMNGLQAPLCGETRICHYSKKAACLGKGEYLAGVVEEEGKPLLLSCCQYSPAVDKHKGDECHEIIIETHDTATVSHPKGPTSTRGLISNSGGQGGGNGKREQVVMETKDVPPGQPNQLVKSIKKFKNEKGEGYVVTVCQPVCERTTTRKPTTKKPESHERKTEDKPVEEKPHKKGIFGDHKCFSSDMTVQTPFGVKRMDQVRAGDQVLVASSDSKPTFAPIEWLYHRDHNVMTEFIAVTTSSNRTLQLSPNHLIPFVPCSNSELKNVGVDNLANAQSYFARRLKIGHCIAALHQDEFVAERIVEIKKISKRGIYSPITGQGTIVVNDLLASCFSSVENHLMQKTVHSLLIQFRHFVSNTWNLVFGDSATLENEDSGIPMPLQMLLKMAQFVLPSNVYSGY